MTPGQCGEGVCLNVCSDTFTLKDAVWDVYRNVKSNPDSLSYLSGPVEILDVFRNSDTFSKFGFDCKRWFYLQTAFYFLPNLSLSVSLFILCNLLIVGLSSAWLPL